MSAMSGGRFLVEIHRSTQTHPWTYALLDQRQREIAAQVQQGAPGVLLLSEVEPVITLGRRAQVESLLLSPTEFSSKGISIYPTDRGGLETYHGPGQWVVFIIERLDRLTGDPRGIKKAIEKFLGVACKVGQKYCADAHIRDGAHLGVWSRTGKFASVGVHVEQGVLLHGLSVNGFRAETSFLGLKPCGLDAPVDFLLKETSSPQLSFEKLGEQLCQAALKSFMNQNEKVDEPNKSGYYLASSEAIYVRA